MLAKYKYKEGNKMPEYKAPIRDMKLSVFNADNFIPIVHSASQESPFFQPFLSMVYANRLFHLVCLGHTW